MLMVSASMRTKIEATHAFALQAQCSPEVLPGADQVSACPLSGARETRVAGITPTLLQGLAAPASCMMRGTAACLPFGA